MHAESPQKAGPPRTIKGLKRQATKLKKAQGIRHIDALEIVAQTMGYTSYKSALNDLGTAADSDLKPNP